MCEKKTVYSKLGHRTMFHDIRSFHDLHQAAAHMQSLSMAEPRGLGFEDEPINASDYIMSVASGASVTVFALERATRVPTVWKRLLDFCSRCAQATMRSRSRTLLQLPRSTRAGQLATTTTVASPAALLTTPSAVLWTTQVRCPILIADV